MARLAVRGIDAHVRVAVGSLDLDAAVAVGTGETVAVMGPNGAGKSTLLRAIAGLVSVQQGHVRVDGELVDGGASGLWVAPDRRSVGIVFQDHLLFPHLSAIDNVAFGLRARGMKRRAARAVAAAWLERLHLSGVGGLRPTALSGGQAQRVALARALVLEPRVLLLDEPMTGLDATTHAATRRELRNALDAFDGACVIVTHDVIDAVALADRVAVIEAGRIIQEGTPDELAAHPLTPFVADLVGVNLFEGDAAGGQVELPTQALALTAARAPDGPVFVMVHPRAVTIHASPPGVASSRNVWPATVTGVAVEGQRTRVDLLIGPRGTSLVAEVTPSAVAELSLRPGSDVWVAVKATEVAVYRR